jgi:hypothetical protein
MPETRTPYTTSTLWETIRHRLETAAQSVGGACVVTMSVVAVNGEPLTWTRPEVLPFEPRRDAAKFARFMAFGSEGVVELDDSGEPVQGE